MNPMPSGAYSSQQAQMKEKRPHGYSQFALNQYTPQQEELFGRQFAQLGPESFTGRLAAGDQSAFEEMEQPALRQFGALQGNIASRFSGMGMGGRKSSGFQNFMNTEAQDFASQLQSQRQDLRRQAIKDLMGLSNTVLNQRPQEKGFMPKKKSGWGEFASSLFGGDSDGEAGGLGNILKLMGLGA